MLPLQAADLFSLSFCLLFSSALFFMGCSGTSGSNTANADASAASGSSTSSSGGAAYSAVIDGKPVSGTGKSGAGRISLEQNATIDGLGFELGSMSGKGPGFQFVINNSGITELRDGKIKTVCNYLSPEGVLYIDDSATVTLNPGTGPRTIGTFSGRWKNAHYGKTPANAPETIQITDGKFDLP